MNNLSVIIKESFPLKNIIIIGDLIADQFLQGSIARVSREAPVFVLRHDETVTLPGGAANSAVNIASLGARATLIGLVGGDSIGDALTRKLAELKVGNDLIIRADEIKTTAKVRVVAGQRHAPRQQVVRIDYENKIDIPQHLIGKLKANLFSAATKADAVIVSDYQYGAANAEIFAAAKQIAAEQNIPLVVDSRFRLTEFSGATTATPNQEEAEQLLGNDFSAADCAVLCEKLHLKALLVTLGNKGMLLTENGKPPVEIKAVGSKNPVDVTGAGDTVIAAYALALAAGLNFADAAKLANRAGGIVVMKEGTASVSAAELIQSVETAAESEISNSKSTV